MKKKIVSVIVAIISVACFIGCSRSADKEEVDIESIKEQVRAELEEENKKAKEEEEEKRQEEERIKEGMNAGEAIDMAAEMRANAEYIEAE